MWEEMVALDGGGYHPAWWSVSVPGKGRGWRSRHGGLPLDSLPWPLVIQDVSGLFLE